MGDFNDDPIDISIKEGLKSVGNLKKLNKNILFNPMEQMFAKGFNTIVLSKIDLNSTGVMYYQIETDGNTATRKMIGLE